MKKIYQNEEEKFKFLKKLEVPMDFLHDIISFLTPKEVLNLSVVNKEWNQKCFSNIYWKQALKKSFQDVNNYEINVESYYFLFKETFKKKNKISYFSGEISTNIFEPIKLVCELGTEDHNEQYLEEYYNRVFSKGINPFPKIYFYDEKIILYFDEKLHCISKRNFQLLWCIKIINLIEFNLDDLNASIICYIDQNLFKIFSLSGHLINEFKIEKFGEKLEVYFMNGLIYYTSFIDDIYYFVAASTDGEILWNIQIKRYSRIYFHKNKIYLHNSSSIISSSTLRCLHFDDFNKKPSSTIEYELINIYSIRNPIFLDDKLYFISNYDGEHILSLNLNSKEILKHKLLYGFVFLNIFNNKIFEYHIETKTLYINDKDYNEIGSISFSFENLHHIYFTKENSFIVTSSKNGKKLISIYSNDLKLIHEYFGEKTSNDGRDILYDDVFIHWEFKNLKIYKVNKEKPKK